MPGECGTTMAKAVRAGVRLQLGEKQVDKPNPERVSKGFVNRAIAAVGRFVGLLAGRR